MSTRTNQMVSMLFAGALGFGACSAADTEERPVESAIEQAETETELVTCTKMKSRMRKMGLAFVKQEADLDSYFAEQSVVKAHTLYLGYRSNDPSSTGYIAPAAAAAAVKQYLDEVSSVLEVSTVAGCLSGTVSLKGTGTYPGGAGPLRAGATRQSTITMRVFRQSLDEVEKVGFTDVARLFLPR